MTYKSNRTHLCKATFEKEREYIINVDFLKEALVIREKTEKSKTIER